MRNLVEELMASNCYEFKVSFANNPYTNDIEIEMRFLDEYGNVLKANDELQARKLLPSLIDNLCNQQTKVLLPR